ncbi:DUF1835 domain-containing protein [Paenibacillus nasutitermitis]|uniref:DUF1835 domain-containing protein n=1 Tax=Paenibacillus nasutitermitis TaxID=1652958 RepID=A0A916YV30_9BACL|nr:DUF1835 domain-containing protein [Paenibacillus nasutitermitis]GGD60985.1 hypothetical protein GCM10010911_18560 [Paenibacillus nasutitermitis]
MDKFQEKLSALHEWEIRAVLNDLLKMADYSTTKREGEERILGEGIMKLWNDRMEEARKRRMEDEELQSGIHLVFSLSDAGALKVTLSEIGKRRENKVLAFNDLFSIGPILHLDKLEGQQRRMLWLMERFSDYHLNSVINQEHQIGQMIETIARIPEHKSITIWCGDNAHDQVGMRFALYLLREREQPVRIVNVSEICKEMPLYIEEQVPPYAQGLIVIDIYREIVKRYNDIMLVEPSRRRRYELEWLEISGQAHMLRLWQDGEIKGSGVDELDGVILGAITKLHEEKNGGGFVKAGSVVNKVFEISNQLVGFQFIEYRIWTLISDGILAFKGLPGAMHQYSIRIL